MFANWDLYGTHVVTHMFALCDLPKSYFTGGIYLCWHSPCAHKFSEWDLYDTGHVAHVFKKCEICTVRLLNSISQRDLLIDYRDLLIDYLHPNLHEMFKLVLVHLLCVYHAHPREGKQVELQRGQA